MMDCVNTYFTSFNTVRIVHRLTPGAVAGIQTSLKWWTSP